MEHNKKEVERITNAIIEANRFVERAKLARENFIENNYVYQSKITASMKRSSMDLTRSLAELRNR